MRSRIHRLQPRSGCKFYSPIENVSDLEPPFNGFGSARGIDGFQRPSADLRNCLRQQIRPKVRRPRPAKFRLGNRRALHTHLLPGSTGGEELPSLVNWLTE